MEAHIQPCPVCGVGINATLSVCPVCHSETHFVPSEPSSAEHPCPACGESVSASASFCPYCGQRLSSAVPASPSAAAQTPPATPPAPQQAQPQQQPVQPAYMPQPTPPPVPEKKKSNMTKVIIGLISALAVAVLVMLILTLTSKSSRNEEQPGSLGNDIAMEHTLDSLKNTLPVSAREVMRYVNDKPALFYLYDNRLHRIDGNTLDDETIDFEEGNHNAKIDYRGEGIIDVKPTKDDRYLFVHASKDSKTHEQILLRYDVKSGRVNVLGSGNSIEEMGSGYRIVGENSEKKIDAYGNIVGDRGTDEYGNEYEEEKPQTDQPRTSKPSKPQTEEVPQTEVITVEPQPVQPAKPVQPAEPQVKNNGTGFHLEEI